MLTSLALQSSPMRSAGSCKEEAYGIRSPAAKLGQTVEESRIVEWLKAEGDPVERGDVLFTVETDKAVLDVEAPRGFLRKILMPAGEMVPVLTVVGLITRTADEPIRTRAVGSAASEIATSEAPKVAPSAPTVAEPSTTAAPGRVFSSPRARKAAADRGIDVTSVKEQALVDGLSSVTCWAMSLRCPRPRQWAPRCRRSWASILLVFQGRARADV